MVDAPFKPDFSKPNPYAGAPTSYVQQIKGTQAYQQAVSAGWIQPPAPKPPPPAPKPPPPAPKPAATTSVTSSPARTTTTTKTAAPTTTTTTSGDTWKPDFTKPDPWAGMPSDYKGVGSFTPTASNPAPPWEGSPGAQNAKIPKSDTPAYKQLAQDIALKQLAPYKDASGKYDITAAIKAGLTSYVDNARFDPIAVLTAKQAVRNEAIFAKSDAQVAQYYKDNFTTLKDGTLISNSAWSQVPRQYQQIGLNQGYQAMVDAINKDAAAGPKATTATITATDAANKLPSDVKAIYDKQSAQDKFAILKAQHVIPDNYVYAGADSKGNPMMKIAGKLDTMGQNVVNSKNMALLLADVLIPGVYTATNWNKMSTPMKAVSVAVDVISILPFIGAAGEGARAASEGAREASDVGMAGRMAGAAKGVGREVVNQLTAPVQMVLHPVETVKGTVAAGRDLLETVTDVKAAKIPEAVLSTTFKTTRIPVDASMTKAEWIEAGDKLMNALARDGGDATIEMNGQTFTMPRSAFMKEIGGGVAHATPFGEMLDPSGVYGQMVKDKTVVEGSLYVAEAPKPRFALATASGETGPNKAMFIFGPSVADDLKSSNKLYHGTRELEKIFPDGYEIDKPVQHFYTRIGAAKVKVDIFMMTEDSKLTYAQRMKLKGLGLVEDLKAPFKPALVVGGTAETEADRTIQGVRDGLTADQVAEVQDVLRSAGATDEARSLGNIQRAANELSARAGTVRTTTAEDTAAEVRVRRSDGSTRNIPIRVSGTPERSYTPIERRGDTTITRRQAPQGRAPARTPPPRVTATPRTPTRIPPRTPPTTPRRTPPTEERQTPPPDRTPTRQPPRIPPERTPPHVPPPRKPPRNPPTNGPPRKPPKPPQTGKPPQAPSPPERRDLTPAEIQGSKVLKAGFGYWLKTPDGKVRFFNHLPEGAHDPGTGPGSGYRSVQSVGGPATDDTIKVGFLNAHLTKIPRLPGSKKHVQYGFNQKPPHFIRPSLRAHREGQILHIHGVGMKRGRAPRGRII